MKSVLIITYYFPPSGGPGVQRVLKFVKYLPQFGWRPVVLTVREGDYPARDESLLAEIPSDVVIYRTPILEPYRLYRRLTGRPADAPVDVENIPRPGHRRSATEAIASFIRSTFFIPDARIGWFPSAIRAASDIIRRENISALYSSSPPYTAALIARTLRHRYRLPWIAGFRDPWTGFLSTPERWIIPRLVDRSLERSVYHDASLVEAAWEGILKDARAKFPDLDPGKLHHLPNGFDSDDFPREAQPTNECFTVTYTGSMYGRRNPEPFLRAVEELAARKAIDPERIELRFVGRFGREVQEMITSSPLKDQIIVRSYVPHSESIRELLKADVLLLVVDEAEGSEEIVPGKVFEYLGARKPIIALAREGAVAALIRETRSGIVVRHDDTAGIQRAFLECFSNFLYRTPPVRQDERAVEKYERREITRRLAGLLDSLTTQSSSS